MVASELALLVVAVVLALIPIAVYFRRSADAVRGEEPPPAFSADDVARGLDARLAPFGFKRRDLTFTRARPEFFDRITIEALAEERLDGGTPDDADAQEEDERLPPRIAIVLGVQARWSLATAEPTDAEACEVRRCVQSGEAPLGWWNCDGDERADIRDVLDAAMDDVTGFFGYFSSIAGSFGEIDIYEIDQRLLPEWFETTTQVRATLYAARARAHAGANEAALALAKYGLRIAGRAVAPRAEFRTIAADAEDAIKAAWASAPRKEREELAAALDLRPGERYLALPIPSPRDEAMIRLMHASTPALQDTVRPEHAAVLLAFAERAATLAVRRGEATLLAAGFRALTLAADMDTRDVITLLPLYLDAAQRLEMDPAMLFANATVWAARDETAASLRSFVNRIPEDRSLESMGYIAAADRDGFRYERTW